MRIDHVQLAAPPGCEEAARAFYGELLGLVEVAKPDALAARGGVWFAINATQQLHVGVDAAFAPARKAHPALAVAPEALDELAARLADAGIAVTWDDHLPAQRRCYVADPWGNRLELLAA
jgi:catechol 2,3-dioxygenase-like lactoylglutathione lyase family enzyme